MRKFALLLKDSLVPMSLTPRKRTSKQQIEKDPHQSDGTEEIELQLHQIYKYIFTNTQSEQEHNE